MHGIIIDSDVVLAETYRLFLGAQGYAVLIAASAQRALELADNHTPDFIILELQLPRHNGIEFLHEFRSHVDWQEVPIIIQSLQSSATLMQYKKLWKQFGITEVHNKTELTLSQLGQIIEKVSKK